MFNININKTDYIVYDEGEYNFIGKVNHGIISLPNYYDLTVAGDGYIKITNNRPIVLPADSAINYDKFTNQCFAGFGEKIDEETYNILYEKFLSSKPNDEYYQRKEKILNDIKSLKLQ